MPITENTGYIESWLQALKSDKKVIVSCAAAAQKASDLVLADTPYQITQPEPT